MIKKTITYTDYFDTKRTEDFYFNLSKTEVLELDLAEDGGLERFFDKIVSEMDNRRIVEMFKKIILLSYGERSLDGRRFIKSPELSLAFSQTEAYTELFLELASDAESAAEFMNGIVPKPSSQDEKQQSRGQQVNQHVNQQVNQQKLSQ